MVANKRNEVPWPVWQVVAAVTALLAGSLGLLALAVAFVSKTTGTPYIVDQGVAEQDLRLLMDDFKELMLEADEEWVTESSAISLDITKRRAERGSNADPQGFDREFPYQVKLTLNDRCELQLVYKTNHGWFLPGEWMGVTLNPESGNEAYTLSRRLMIRAISSKQSLYE